MALKDILNNAKYADDMVLSLPDNTSMTVGEMRALEAEEKRSLVERSRVIEQAEMALADRITEAQRRGYLGQPQTLPDAEIRREAAEQFGLREDDPLLGQVAKEFKRLQAEQKTEIESVKASFKSELDNLKGITGKVTGAYLNDYYDARFQAESAALPQALREKVKLEDAIKYAEEHKLMDKVGRYDIKQAVDRLTWEDRKATILAAERADLVKKSEREAELARMNRPSPNTIRTRHKENEGFNPLNKEGKVKSFDEALADAAEDTSLWDSIAATASGFGPN